MKRLLLVLACALLPNISAARVTVDHYTHEQACAYQANTVQSIAHLYNSGLRSLDQTAVLYPEDSTPEEQAVVHAYVESAFALAQRVSKDGRVADPHALGQAFYERCMNEKNTRAPAREGLWRPVASSERLIDDGVARRQWCWVKKADAAEIVRAAGAGSGKRSLLNSVREAAIAGRIDPERSGILLGMIEDFGEWVSSRGGDDYAGQNWVDHVYQTCMGKDAS